MMRSVGRERSTAPRIRAGNRIASQSNAGWRSRRRNQLQGDRAIAARSFSLGRPGPAAITDCLRLPACHDDGGPELPQGSGPGERGAAHDPSPRKRKGHSVQDTDSRGAERRRHHGKTWVDGLHRRPDRANEKRHSYDRGRPDRRPTSCRTDPQRQGRELSPGPPVKWTSGLSGELPSRAVRPHDTAKTSALRTALG